MRVRVAVLVLASLIAGCDGPPCPDAWEGGTEHAEYCEPPPSVTEAAEKNLETGIYGYVVACTVTDDQPCSLDNAYFYDGGEITILPDLPDGGAGDPIDVKLGQGSTFEVELPPDVKCFPGNPINGTFVDGEKQEDGSVRLAPGEVRFVLFKVFQKD